MMLIRYKELRLCSRYTESPQSRTCDQDTSAMTYCHATDHLPLPGLGKQSLIDIVLSGVHAHTSQSFTAPHCLSWQGSLVLCLKSHVNYHTTTPYSPYIYTKNYHPLPQFPPINPSFNLNPPPLLRNPNTIICIRPKRTPTILSIRTQHRIPRIQIRVCDAIAVRE